MPTEFIGVSPDPRRGVTRETGLYEFWTGADEHVYLHDTDLVSLLYSPGPPVPTLRAKFRYDDDSVPLELAEKPVVIMDFEDVRVLHWEEDEEALAAVRQNIDAAAAAGQMSDLEWNGDSEFTIVSFTLTLFFTAQRVRLTTAAG
ncbi:MAG: hypothetical protein M3P34_04405 [Actinomycetota bacterium]|nr:hypothetical protein [Actinomycetota bacterium]